MTRIPLIYTVNCTKNPPKKKQNKKTKQTYSHGLGGAMFTVLPRPLRKSEHFPGNIVDILEPVHN